MVKFVGEQSVWDMEIDSGHGNGSPQAHPQNRDRSRFRQTQHRLAAGLIVRFNQAHERGFIDDLPNTSQGL